jgi:hypothetical protein
VRGRRAARRWPQPRRPVRRSARDRRPLPRRPAASLTPRAGSCATSMRSASPHGPSAIMPLGNGGPLVHARLGTRACHHCGQPCAVGQYTRGRCHACYTYWWRHGRERPLPGRVRERRPPVRCGNCGELCDSNQRARGRCGTCYQYWYRYQRERPPWLFAGATVARPPRRCGHCGRAVPHLSRGRCGTCYHYWWRHGRDRSLTPPQPVQCQDCQRPVTAARRGRCGRCYMRWWRAQRPGARTRGGEGARTPASGR